MKYIAIILLGLLLAAPCIAMGEQAIYIKGIDDGYYLGILAWQARGNATAAELYNAEVVKYNAWLKSTLSESEYKLEELALLPMPDESYLPQVIREWDGKNVWS